MFGFLANKKGCPFRVWGPRVRPIGLDVGHNSIKMIQLYSNGDRLGVVAADKVEFDPAINDDAEKRRSFAVSAIKQMVGRGKFQGRDVISCLSNEQLKIKPLRIDACVGEEIETKLGSEIANRLGLDTDTDAINYMVAGEVCQGDETKTELILFTAAQETIKKHIEFLEESGLGPVAIDTVPCALFRNFEKRLRRQVDTEAVNVFVDLGDSFTTMVIARGKELVFVKQIPIGGRQFNVAVSTRLGITVREAGMLRKKLRQGRRRSNIDGQTGQIIVDAMQEVIDELAKEISLCFRYYAVTFRGRRPRRAVFTGGEAYEQRLMNTLNRQVGVEVEIAEPLADFDLTKMNFDGERRGPLCEWAVAVGLGLKDLSVVAESTV